MSWPRVRELPIFWQAMLLILASLFVAQLVTIGLFLLGPPPRPDFVSLRDVADAVAPAQARGQGRWRGRGPGRDDPPRLERVAITNAPPAATEGMVSDPGFTAALARYVSLPPARLRLLYEADQSESFPYRREVDARGVPMRHGEPLFFNTVVAAVERPDGRWTVLRSPPKPWISAWQRRSLIWFAVSAILMVPIVFLFARALTRPMRRLAGAVEALGHRPDAPPLPVEGPAELRLTAEALNALRSRAQDYMSERNAMIGAIAHDLRTPLARIAFRIEGAPPPLRDPIQADVEQMRAMVAATIGFLRSGAGPVARGRVDLRRVAAKVVDHAIEMGGDVRFESAVGAAVVEGDAVALERLIENLVGNAVKYAGGGEVLLVGEDAAYALAVRDRGPGVPATRIEELFRPFERGDPSRSRATGGLGLGLAIARAIAAAHGGSLTARNRDGGGLELRCVLPAV